MSGPGPSSPVASVGEAHPILHDPHAPGTARRMMLNGTYRSGSLSDPRPVRTLSEAQEQLSIERLLRSPLLPKRQGSGAPRDRARIGMEVIRAQRVSNSVAGFFRARARTRSSDLENHRPSFDGQGVVWLRQALTSQSRSVLSWGSRSRTPVVTHRPRSAATAFSKAWRASVTWLTSGFRC